MTESAEEQLDELTDQLEAITELGERLVDAAIRDGAAETGRTLEEQEERIGDHFAFIAAEADPHQKQLVDYELSGDTVAVCE